MNMESKTDNLTTGVRAPCPSLTSRGLLIHRAYKYRIYPDAEQRKLLAKHFGCCRFVYNHFLAYRNDLYKAEKKIEGYVKNAAAMAKMKKDGRHEWLGEVYSHAMQAELRHLDEAFKQFYKAIRSGKATPVVKNGKPTGRLKYEPRFKSKKDFEQSATFPDNVKVEEGRLVLPKFKKPIKMKMHRPSGGRICHATVSKDCRGKYYVSILCEEECAYLPRNDKSIGIDLGLKEMAVCSNGERIANPRFLERAEKRTKHLQRQISRKKEGEQPQKESEVETLAAA